MLSYGKPIPRNSAAQFCADIMPVEVWSSSALATFKHHDPQCSMTCSVTVHGLYVVSIPKRFHSPVLALIVDCGVSNRDEVS